MDEKAKPDRVGELLGKFGGMDSLDDYQFEVGRIVGELAAIARGSEEIKAEYRRQIERLEARVTDLEDQLT